MVDKTYRKIRRTIPRAVLDSQITGAADWWLRETSNKIIQPLLTEFPVPGPVGVAERIVRIQAIQAEIEEMKRHAFVLPVSAVRTEGGVRKRGSAGCSLRRALQYQHQHPPHRMLCGSWRALPRGEVVLLY